METKDLDQLVQQMRHVLLNKPIPKELKCTSSECVPMESAIGYLADCLKESNRFLKELCVGNFQVSPPGRNNFQASQLKELHSILKHLTWQTTQVANGDYQQQVNFLGEFSDSFNKMVTQLGEREIALKEKSQALKNSVALMVSIMDHQKDWIIVLDGETGEIIYMNRSVKNSIEMQDHCKNVCTIACPLMVHMRSCTEKTEHTFEFSCTTLHKTLSILTYPIQWNETSAFAHYISDITEFKEEKELLLDMAYNDELTGIYNRRYCLETIEAYLRDHVDFALVVIDLDGLKMVNDTFGHIKGDAYIITVVNTVNDFIRSADTFCRMGGDEFILLLRDCSEQGAQRKMELIHDVIAAKKAEYPLSISFGVTQVSADTSLSQEILIKQTDEKMYLMKKNK